MNSKKTGGSKQGGRVYTLDNDFLSVKSVDATFLRKTDKLSMWMLDTDYDGRSLFPKQVFFPMSGQKDGWSRLAKNMKAEIDEELIEAYRGTVSLPFETGDNRRIKM